jgi:integration host factor subunit beta
MHITKLEFTDALRDETGLSKKKARDVVDIFLDEISDALARGDRVELRDFCTFLVRDHEASTRRNPRHRREQK